MGGSDGWFDLFALAATVDRDQLVAPLEQGAPFQFTSEQVMNIILRVCLNTP